MKRTNITSPATIRAAKEPSQLAKKLISGKYLQGFQQMLSLACSIALDEAFMVGNSAINILGVDLDDEILTDAKEKENERLTIMKHDVTHPFAFPRLFDCVYSRNLLHYFNNILQRQILSNIFNTMLPGGLFVFQLKAISDFFYTHPAIERVPQADGMLYFPSMGYSRNHLSEDEVDQLLKNTGFVIEEMYSTTEYLYEDSHKSTLINCFARR